MALNLVYRPTGPTLAAFRAAPAFARALVGPIHGGRRTCCVYDLVLRALDPRHAQRRWRFLIARATGEALLGQTLAAWHRVVPAAVGAWEPKALRHQFEIAVPGCEARLIDVQFLALDRPEHRRRLAAGDATAVWLDGARELPETVLDDAIAASGMWPPLLDGALAWSGVLASSRMPPEDHWLRRRFEASPGSDYALFRQPGGRSAQAEAAHLDAGFYHRAAAGKPADWVATHIDAEWAVAARGAGTMERLVADSFRAEAA